MLVAAAPTIPAQSDKLQGLENEMFGAIADNLPFGIAMFSHNLQMIMCNRAYREMYRLNGHEARPGISVGEIVEARVRAGTAPMREQTGAFIRNPEQVPLCGELKASDVELRDGRTCSVVRQALPGGGWVSLHVDVTSQRRVDREVEFLADAF